MTVAHHPSDTLLRIMPDTRTPCCSRIPKHLAGRRYFCRGCGVIFIDAAALVRQTFPGAYDVTGMTPRRLLKGASDADVS